MNKRTKNLSYIEDDGWNLPVEISEEIEYRVQETVIASLQDVARQRTLHKGDYITKAIVEKYQAKAWLFLVMNGYQYTGMVRALGKELQEKYGVTELEAINILNDQNVDDYLNKYNRIKNLIPNIINEHVLREEIRDEYLEITAI